MAVKLLCLWDPHQGKKIRTARQIKNWIKKLGRLLSQMSQMLTLWLVARLRISNLRIHVLQVLRMVSSQLKWTDSLERSQCLNQAPPNLKVAMLSSRTQPRQVDRVMPTWRFRPRRSRFLETKKLKLSVQK